jgi:hypothetical protein
MNHRRKAVSSSFMPARSSAIALTDKMRICPCVASTFALTLTCRPSIPQRASGLQTFQILRSLSTLRVLPWLPTSPERLVSFLELLRVSEL